MLYASGYLTRTDPKHYRKFTTIKIPNKEVKEIFATDVQRWFEQSMQNKNLSSFADYFWCGNSQHLKNELTNILYETISYFDYDEKYYHGFIIGILKVAGIHAISNTEEGLGRPDIVIKDHIKNNVLSLK